MLILLNMQIRFNPRIGKSIPAILVIAAALYFVLMNAVAISTVVPGESIQSAIDATSVGQIIEVQNGTYFENVNVTKSVTLKGVGNPIVDAGGRGSAITLSANNSILQGFTATGSGSDSRDAGIAVLSSGNILKGNSVTENGNYGIAVYHSDDNTLFKNDVTENRNGGILLDHSDSNQVWGNYARGNGFGISIDTCRANIINSNNLTGNKIGINITNNNMRDSVVNRGKGISIEYKSSSQSEAYSIDKNSTVVSIETNLIYDNNLQDNELNAYDDGNNRWDNDKSGNHYSSYDSREQGCKDRNRDGICDKSYSISGGNNVDELPKASEDAILSYKARGLAGSLLKIEQRNYLPGEDINVKYIAPGNISGSLCVLKAGGSGTEAHGKASKNDGLSSCSFAGSAGELTLMAPLDNGSYEIVMFNGSSNEQIASLGFKVRVPTVSATPESLYSCEKITVSYSGVPGFENDWIGMYKPGDSDTSPISRRYLDGKENGTVAQTASNPGSYEFRIFKNDSYTRLAVSNTIVANAYKGTKVVVSPTVVSPGGTVTVTYWGAPASGSGVIGMYGMSRPDKFPIETRGLGSSNCGSMTWRLPTAKGQYDFRMFYQAITSINQGAYQLLGQTDVVTVK